MAINKSSFILIFVIILHLSIHNANADWKFWKKDKSDTSTTTTTTTTTIAPSTKPGSGAINKGILSAGDAGLTIGVGTTGTNIKNNLGKQQKPNPGLDLSYSQSNPSRIDATGTNNNKNYRDWAVNFAGAGDEIPKAPGSPTPGPGPGPGPGPRNSINPMTSTTPSSKNVQGHRMTPAQSTPIPRSSVNIQIPSSSTTSAPKNVGNGQKLVPTPSSPGVGGKSWADVTKGRPESPSQLSKGNLSPNKNIAEPSQLPGGNLNLNKNIQRPGTLATGSSTVAPKKIYLKDPVYSKGNTVTDDDLEKLSEALFGRDDNNAWKYITMNLQKQTTSGSPVDEAPQPLLTVNNEALKISTIDKVLKIYDNYHLNTLEHEYISPLQREEESLLVDTFLSTNVMSAAMRFLADKGFFKRDYYEYKYILRQIWFSLYSRNDGKIGSSGFEHVFMGELKLGTEVLGLHNWIYFNSEETNKHADYLGYIKKLDLGKEAAILKIHTKFNNIDKPVTTMFIGTSPELEMALYTVCFFARPDKSCPVQLGGSKFNIMTHKFRYRSKDLIGSAYPEI